MLTYLALSIACCAISTVCALLPGGSFAGTTHILFGPKLPLFVSVIGKDRIGHEVAFDKGGIGNRIRWTNEMDDKLNASVAQHKAEGWAKVAEHMGGGLSASQCGGRWNTLLSNRDTAQHGPWTAEEVRYLMELVPQHVIKPHWSRQLKVMTRERTDWKTIGTKLQKSNNACLKKWLDLQSRGMPYECVSPDIDALIKQRVTEWGDKGNGLWVSLQHETGMSLQALRRRWAEVIADEDTVADRVIRQAQMQQSPPLLKRKPVTLKWTPLLDARLSEGVDKYINNGSWARVAEHVGGGITRQQCLHRWNNYLSKAQQEGIKLGDWSDEEIRTLEELVPRHVIQPHWSKHLKALTKERVDWTAMGVVLNRIPSECCNKWDHLQASRMKKGRFTAEESALILKRVAEWGDKGNGLWVSLQEEMGRSAHVISRHWREFLSRDRD